MSFLRSVADSRVNGDNDVNHVARPCAGGERRVLRHDGPGEKLAVFELPAVEAKPFVVEMVYSVWCDDI